MSNRCLTEASRGARVADLERARVEALAREMVTELRQSGSDRLVVEAATLEDVERWRRAARLLGLRVVTRHYEDDTRVWAVFYEDRPVTEAEQRRAALIMGEMLRGIRPPLTD